MNLSIFALFCPTAVAITVSIRHGFDLKVRITKVMDNVPAQLWKCLPLQQDAVTEAEGEEKSSFLQKTAVEPSLRHQLVETLHLTFTSRGQQGAVLTLWRMLRVGCISYCTICVSR